MVGPQILASMKVLARDEYFEREFVLPSSRFFLKGVQLYSVRSLCTLAAILLIVLSSRLTC